MHTYLAAPFTRDLAGKVCRDRAGDARCGAFEEQASHKTWISPGQLRDLHGPCNGEFGASAIDDAHAASCQLG